MRVGCELGAGLLLGGLLADLSAEHYTWVATGDKRSPDATTVQSRADAFLARLQVLFTKGMILVMPNTFTGATLKFLETTRYYQLDKGVQTIGIGDWKHDVDSRKSIRSALNRVIVIVENMKEYMKLYRPEHSWLHAFTAFRLPSPLSASGEAGAAARASVKACLRRITKDAQLHWSQAFCKLMRMLLVRKRTISAVYTRVLHGGARRRSGPNSRAPAASWSFSSFGKKLLAIWNGAFGGFARFDAPSGQNCLTSQSKTACSWSRRRLAKYCARCSRRFRMLARAGIRQTKTIASNMS